MKKNNNIKTIRRDDQRTKYYLSLYYEICAKYTQNEQVQILVYLTTINFTILYTQTTLSRYRFFFYSRPDDVLTIIIILYFTKNYN